MTTMSDVVDGLDNETSLREAVAFANSNPDASTITFAPALAGSTITLGDGELVLSSDVTIDGDIDGDDAADITISGGGASRVFNATTGTSRLDALTITGGHVSNLTGGGLNISYGATVVVANSTLSGNTSEFSRGGGAFVQPGATLRRHR